MAQIDDFAAQLVTPLAAAITSDKTRVVQDAFRLVIPPEEEYVESDVVIESLEFASYAVGGLAAAAKTPGAGVRASSEVTLPLADSSGTTEQSTQSIVLYGPGDVQGIDPQQILRRYPAPGTPNAEETALPHIEFDRPEVPWAFSAATPENRLRPWLTLVVVEKAHARWMPATDLLPLLELPVAELPPLSGAHLWAHAQTTWSNTIPLATRLSPEFARVNLSRLVSPRVLKEETDYLAAVVPTTDVGARGGRGVSGGTLLEAWSSGVGETVVLPVYDSWEFRTGEDGDFQTLALRLKGVAAPYEVGRRFIDTSEPGRPLASLPDGEPGAKQVLRCALYSPTPPPPDKEEAETASWPASKTAELRQQLDLPAQIEGSEEQTDGIPDVPIIGPKIYAKLHRGAAVITGDDWFAELNLSPMHRIVAGLGTRVVQTDQEQLMQAAWAQLGDVERANRAIALAELGELLASRLHVRLAALEPSRLLQVAAPLAARVSVAPGLTVAAEVAASATPATVLSGAFRRSMRPDGPMLRRADVATRSRAGTLVGTGDSTRDFTRVYENPDGVASLSAESIAELDPAFVAPVLDISIASVPEILRRADSSLEGGVFAHFADATAWRAAEPGFDLGSAVVERWSEAVLRESTIPAVTGIRDQRIAPLVAELATAKAGAGLPLAGALEERAKTLNNSMIVRFGDAGGGDIGVVGGGVVDRGDIGVVGGGAIDRGDIGVVGGGAIDRGVIDRGVVGRGDIGIVGGGAIGRGVVGRGDIGAVGGGIRRGGAIIRGNAIGGAVARVPLDGGRALRRAGAGRTATGLRGVSILDVSSLSRVTTSTSREATTKAFTELAALATVPVSPVIDAIQALQVDQLRSAIPALLDPAGIAAIAPVTRRDTVRIDSLASVLDPRTTVRAALRGRLHLSAELASRVFLPHRIRRIMAAPIFRRPMYEALHAYSPDWLIPGLGLLPDTDFVTVLATNSQFMEAFLVGLSDEMGRELLWRNYPTDQSGTYFRRFWDKDEDELKQQIHAFTKADLGKHVSIGGSGGSEPRAVIVVKSDLVRRYPDVIIQAVKNHGTKDAPQFDGPQAVIARQLFAAHLQPDVALVGVDLGLDEIDGEDWWITIAEHPTATRFNRPQDAQTRAARFYQKPSLESAAAFAVDRLHEPVRVAFHATDLVVWED